jgi:hypothetical protein
MRLAGRFLHGACLLFNDSLLTVSCRFIAAEKDVYQKWPFVYFW